MKRCAYEWRSPTGKGPDYTAVGTNWSADPVVLGMLQSQFPPASKLKLDTYLTTHLTSLQTTFRKQIGPVDITWSDASPKVVIGVPDSSPKEDVKGVVPPGSGNHHGYNVANIARSVGCKDNAPCPIHVMTEPALTYPESSGYYGTVGTLAAAVRALVDRKPKGERLVLNLSVGWEPNGDGSCDVVPVERAEGQQGKSAPVGKGENVASLLKKELQRAVCKGAIVIAAAGNDPGYTPKLNGLMCPASWGVEDAPSQDACAKLGVDAPDVQSDKLLYAVGAVDDAYPISTTRQKGLPALVAPGHLGVALADVNYSEALTGTSVSAAAMSGMVAALWAYAPQKKASDVMNILQSSAAQLTVDATLLAGAQPKKASLCKAFAQVCSPSSGCSDVSLSACDQPLAINLSVIAKEQAQLDDFFQTITGWSVTTTLVSAPAAPQSQPFGQYLYPQPNDPPCPTCRFDKSENKLYVVIDPAFPVSSCPLTNMTLKFFDANRAFIDPGGTFANLPPTQGLYPRDSVQDIISGEPTNAVYATLTWTQPGGVLVTQDIDVVE